MTIEAQAPLHEIAEMFRVYDIKRLPVMRGGRIAGIVSRSDLVRAMATMVPSPAKERSLGGLAGMLAGMMETESRPPETQPSAAPVVVAPAVTAAAPQTSGLTTTLGVVAPQVSATTWVPALCAAFDKYDMTSNKRMAAAVGQFLVEAGAAFQETVENLNYTSAKRISAVFPHRFPTPADAVPYVGKPEALANAVYANRLGNGDEASGDGWKFRGRGLIQLTGRDEYAEFASTAGMSVDEASAYCETPVGAAMSGCWYLSSRGCLLLADTWQIDKITLKVNGSAMEAAEQRADYSNACLKALGG
jgi:predicted chitinase